jgi:hypothetical protein
MHGPTPACLRRLPSRQPQPSFPPTTPNSALPSTPYATWSPTALGKGDGAVHHALFALRNLYRLQVLCPAGQVAASR